MRGNAAIGTCERQISGDEVDGTNIISFAMEPHTKEQCMNHVILKSVRALCSGSLAALCLVSAAQAQTAPAAPTTPPSSGMPHIPPMQHDVSSSRGMGSHDMKQSMMTGMEGMQKMPMSGDTDKDFAMMMKMHHQQGVEMARMEVAHGKSPAMKAMARNIISAQNKEIAKFDQWLARQKK